MRELFKTTRKSYVALRGAKRKFRNQCKVHKSAYHRMNRAYAKLLDAHVEAHRHIADPSQAKKLNKAFLDYQKAHQAFSDSFNALSEAMDNLQKTEIPYTVMLFKNLMSEHKLRITDIAAMFGVWNTRVTDWLRSNKHIDLIEVFEKEFGSIEIEEDEAKPED